MIAILKHGTTTTQREQLIAWLKRMNVDVHISEGAEDTVLGPLTCRQQACGPSPWYDEKSARMLAYI